MKKQLIIILLLPLCTLYTTNVFAEAAAGVIGAKDDRRLGSLSDPEFRGVVRLELGTKTTTYDIVDGGTSILTREKISGGTCTGVFIDKNWILTNSHCALECDNYCIAEFYNPTTKEMDKIDIKETLFYGDNDINYENGNDWALLRTEKPVPDSSTVPIGKSSIGKISYGGFGGLRIIKDEEIEYLKDLYFNPTIKRYCESNSSSDSIEYIQCVSEKVDEILENDPNVPPLFTDEDNFKVQVCNIKEKQNEIVLTDCDSSSGYSGAPYLRSNTIVGLNSSHIAYDLFDIGGGAKGLNTSNFITKIPDMINEVTPPIATAKSDTPQTTNTIAVIDPIVEAPGTSEEQKRDEQTQTSTQIQQNPIELTAQNIQTPNGSSSTNTNQDDKPNNSDQNQIQQKPTELTAQNIQSTDNSSSANNNNKNNNTNTIRTSSADTSFDPNIYKMLQKYDCD